MFDRHGQVQCVGCGDPMKARRAEVLLHATCVEFVCEKCNREQQFMLPRAKASARAPPAHAAAV